MSTAKESNDPRHNHFVPQSWIKRFADSDRKIWCFDKVDGLIRARGAKRLMQLFNIYTLQPSGIDDTTLESNEFNKIDNELAQVFDRVLKGDLGNDVKQKLAAKLAIQIMRDPMILASYQLKTQEFALSLLDIFSTPDYKTFLQVLKSRYPVADITEFEYNHLKSFSNIPGEKALEQVIIELDDPEGTPALPFTDLIRNPSGLDIICDHLLRSEWYIKTDPNEGFVLGDTGVLYERNQLDSLKAPLSKSTALYLKPSNNPAPGIIASDATPHEVEALNWESSARARRWLVGPKATLEKTKSQVGSPMPEIFKRSEG